MHFDSTIPAARRHRALPLRAALLGVVAVSTLGLASMARAHDDVAYAAPCDNDQLARVVNGRLFDLKNADARGIEVSVRDGVVTLHGLVTTSVERGTVVDSVGAIPGVTRVIDAMDLGPN